MASVKTDTPRSLSILERRRFVLSLRKKAVSYDGIAKAVKRRFPNAPPKYSDRSAYHDVHTEIERLALSINEDTEEIKRLEEERLDALIHTFYAQAKDGDAEAARVFLRLQERRSWLAGVAVARVPHRAKDWRAELAKRGVKASEVFEDMVVQFMNPPDAKKPDSNPDA